MCIAPSELPQTGVRGFACPMIVFFRRAAITERGPNLWLRTVFIEPGAENRRSKPAICMHYGQKVKFTRPKLIAFMLFMFTTISCTTLADIRHLTFSMEQPGVPGLKTILCQRGLIGVPGQYTHPPVTQDLFKIHHDIHQTSYRYHLYPLRYGYHLHPIRYPTQEKLCQLFNSSKISVYPHATYTNILVM